MSKSRMLQEIKGIVYDLLDNNGNFRAIPIGMIGTRKLSDDRIKLLQNFISLLRDTQIVTRETKLYIFTRYINIRGVNELLNEEAKEHGGKEVNYNTTMSKIGYDRLKIEKIFSPTFLSDIILECNNEEIIAHHTESLVKAYMKYGESNMSKLRDNLALDLSKDCLCLELDDERFNGFLSVIMPYIKSHMAKIASELDKECIGYFNYLLVSPIKTDIDKERLSYIEQLLGPQENQSYINSKHINNQYEVE